LPTLDRSFSKIPGAFVILRGLGGSGFLWVAHETEHNPGNNILD
jgi:hypothetical protein